jgi:hypothetical protein
VFPPALVMLATHASGHDFFNAIFNLACHTAIIHNKSGGGCVTTPYDPYATATSQLPVATASQIPGNIVGINSATINTSEMNITSGAGAVYGYAGQPGTGNLYIAIAASGGTDNFGNTFSTGLNALAGAVQGFSIVGSVMDSTSTLQGTQIQQAAVLNPSINGGTSVSMTHTMTNTGGPVLGYTAGATAITFSTAGIYSWTCPTGVTSIQVQCWGGGGGADGGNSTQGGAGGGGGEYASEPSLAVTPGNVYTITVGQSGFGGASAGNGGGSGGQSNFSNSNGLGQGVTANPGSGGVDFTGGEGGAGSGNTIHFDGGNGAFGSGNTGGAGGGGSASAAGEGNNGFASGSSTGGVGGAGISGGGAGGAGGNSGASGSNGAAPGAGGGGAGADGTATQTASYTPSQANGVYTYYGAAASNPYGLRGHNGLLYQGLAASGNTDGYQYAIITLPYALIQSQLAGKTISSCALQLTNLHSYYSSGMYVEVQYVPTTSFGSSFQVPVSGQTAVENFHIDQNDTLEYTLGLGGGIGVALQNGNCSALLIGSGDFSPFQDWYGYFTGTGVNEPVLYVFYNDGGVASAGNGAAGQVILTYNASSSPVYTLSVSSQTGADVYGNPYQTGFQGPQLTLTGSASPPTGVTGSAVVSSNTAGTIIISGGLNAAAAIQADTEIVMVGQSGTPSAVTDDAVVYSTGTGSLTYVDGTDSEPYNTGRRTLYLTSGTNISSTVPSTSGLATTVGARPYRISGMLIITAPGSAPGAVALELACPSGASGQLGLLMAHGTTTATTTIAPNALTGIGATMGASAIYLLSLDGVIIQANAGTMTLEAAVVSPSTSYAIDANSYIDIMPIG